MSRESGNVYVKGRLYGGYDYENQAWVVDGKYIRCGHTGDCVCYGKAHAGERCEVRDVTREEQAKKLTETIYKLYGSGSGGLFGIPPEYKTNVEMVVQVVLILEDGGMEK